MPPVLVRNVGAGNPFYRLQTSPSSSDWFLARLSVGELWKAATGDVAVLVRRHVFSRIMPRGDGKPFLVLPEALNRDLAAYAFIRRYTHRRLVE